MSDLRKFLDAHGNDGAPTEPGLYVLSVVYMRGLDSHMHGPFVAVIESIDDGALDYTTGPYSACHPAAVFLRHAPLPPLAGTFKVCGYCAGGAMGWVGAGTPPACKWCGPASHVSALPGVRWVPFTDAATGGEEG